MATLSELVAAIATAEGIDVERVSAIARAIRELGLIRTSGRGTSAAQMSEADAANLLIATNTADTARTAAAYVDGFRELRTKRRPNQFGSELEELISAAKRECIADYLNKMVAIYGTRGHRPGRPPHANWEYEIAIRFEKPIPSVQLGIWGGQNDPVYIDFLGQGHAANEGRGDLTERKIITHRTIQAVGNALRT